MQVIPFTDRDWKKDHPTGTLAFRHLLRGDPGSPDNFMYILARQDADFSMPRHRHNFDQIRLPLSGAMNLGRGLMLGEGQVGYFPEGLPYGPQEDPLGAAQPGERLQLVLQFGGASGYGFMSIEQRRQAWDELSKIGTFVGPHFHRPDGSIEWALNTVWQHVFGDKLKYPRPRYRQVVIVDPVCFHWVAVAGTTGVEHKPMGAFSERGVWVEMIRLRPRATWSSTDARARRLFVVTRGAGRAGDQALARLTALRVDPGETLDLTAHEELELFLIGLPPIEMPAIPSDQFDTEELVAE